MNESGPLPEPGTAPGETQWFAFANSTRLRPWSRLFGIRAERCTVTLSPTELTVHCGRWTLSTTPANVAAVEVDGPYRWWKVAGPPRLSLADLGITFATTDEAGVCIELRRPVGAIDPLHVIPHPNVTLTVADPERFAEALRHVVATAPGSPGVPETTVSRQRGSLLETMRALLRWRRRSDSIVVRERPVDTVAPPRPSPLDGPEAQDFEDGAGAAFHRRYRVVMPHPTMTATAAMDLVKADLNTLTREDFAPFNQVAGTRGDLRTGDRFVVQLAGPWDGPVEVVEVTPTSFRLATLDGHMEAGQIEFSATDHNGTLMFTIESWARSGDAGMDALYDRIGIAKHLQSEMWVEACEAIADLASAGPHEPVEVLTERATDEPTG